MPSTNIPPSTTNEVNGLAFPFQRGKVGFPAMCKPDLSVMNSIRSLLMTGKNERVMRPGFGVDTYKYVFDTISPILQAKIAADVTQQIQLYEPRAQIISVIPSLRKSDTNQETTLVFDIEYQVGNQVVGLQVDLPPQSLGV